MKKLLVVLIIGLFYFNAIGQSQHLTFKDIPIDGNISNFVEKLKNVGFSLTEMKVSAAIMKGRFAGKDCEIIIGSSPKTNTVWKVSAYLPVETSWSSINSSYDSYKEQYQQKYGVPTKSFEFFSDPYYQGDGYELQAISMEKCTYYTYWDSELGTISVEISKFKQIRLSYEDGANSKIADKEKSEKIQSDI